MKTDFNPAAFIAFLRTREILDAADARLVTFVQELASRKQEAAGSPRTTEDEAALTALTVVIAALCRACASGSLCLALTPEVLTPVLVDLLRAARLAQGLNQAHDAHEEFASIDAAEEERLAEQFTTQFLRSEEGGRFAGIMGSPEQPGPLVRAFGNLYWHRYWFAARSIADGLRDRAARSSPVEPAAVDAVLQDILTHSPLRAADDSVLVLTEAQHAALALSLTSSVFVLAGGPGTGKTTWTATWLRAVLRLPGVTPDRIRLCAPTGRAARRLEESLRAAFSGVTEDPCDSAAATMSVTTLHTLLGWRAFEGRFARDPDDPLDADYVLLDEASMADVFLMSALVRALKPEARLVLAGDPGQLPAVEAGAVLGELLPDPEGTPGPLPAVTLEGSHRAKGDVIPLAAAVRRADADTVLRLLGNPVPPDEAFGSVRPDKPASKHALTRIDSPYDTSAGLRKTLEAYADALFNTATLGDPDYATLLTRFRTLTRDAETHAIDALWNSAGRARVLAPLRRGPFSAERANKILRERLEPAWQRPDDVSGAGFHGAPILVTRNDTRTGLSNGDIGLWLETADGAAVFFPRPDLPDGWLRLPVALLPACELGFASTVHKSQGSECDEVLIVLPEAGNRLLARETLYTAITRARLAVRVFGAEEAIREAVIRTLRRAGGVRELLDPAAPSLVRDKT